MEFKTEKQREAYKYIMGLIDDFQNSMKIEGKHFHDEEAARYNKIAVLCIKLFKKDKDTKIEIEKPEKDKPFVCVKVYTDEFEVSKENKADFIELIQLSDNVIFYGDEQDRFHFSFYVDNIWTE